MKTIKLIKCVLLFALILNSAILKAQTTVRGKVIDSKDKQGVIGASVQELDADKRVVMATQTDISGNFFLRISNPKNQIQISFIGYKTQVVAINNRSEINISLESNAKDLSEVVIVGRRRVDNGTGLMIDERNNTFATASVSQKDLEELSALSIDQALQGRLPGVDISATSGDPGAGMSIRIRGTSSLNGNAEPLIVVDNMPYETEVPPDFNFSTADEQGYAQLLNIAPSDILTITVLQDAASTAIWGSRGANGVLAITTKRGAIGSPQVNYTFTGVMQKQPESIPLLNGDQYSSLIPEEIANRKGLPIDQLTNPEFSYDPLMPSTFYNYNKNTDWVEAVTRTGYQQTHNVNMQGGGDKAAYFISFGYGNNIGPTVGTDLDRITSSVRLDYNVSNKIRFRTDFAYTHISQNQNYGGDVRGKAYIKMPNMAIYQYDEYGNQTPNYFSPAANIQGQYPGTYNVLAMANEAVSKNTGERMTPKFNLQYRILPNNVLTSSFDIQFDINNTKTRTFLPQIATGRPATETSVNRASDGDGDAYNIYSRIALTFVPQIKNEKHTLTSSLFVSASDNSSFAYSATISNTASSNLQDAADPGRSQNSDLGLSASIGRSRRINAALQTNYTFLDRYILGFTANFDGSSSYGPNNRTRLFPSASVRWRLSDEKFMKGLTFLDEFSLRASYGLTGGGSGGGFYNTYVPTSYSYMGLSGITPGNIGLDDLKPQITHGLNVGFNLTAMKSKIRVDGNVYRNRITDLYFNGLQIPNYTGYSSIAANVGTMTNSGFDVTLNTTPLRTKNWIVNIDFNIAKNINVINEASEYFPRTDGKKVNENGVYRTFLQIGNPFGSFYGFRYKGVYADQDATVALDANGSKILNPTTGQPKIMRFNYPATDYEFQQGDARYEDINHDGNITEADIVYLGNGNPKITGGFGSKLTFKGNLTLSTFFNYRYGNDLINNTLMNTTRMSGYDNQSTRVLRRWRNPGDVTDVPRALYNGGFNWLGSDRYVSDASFIRLKTVTMRYTLTKELLNRLKIKNASVYLTAENLYTWTKYLGVDPEVGTRGPNTPFSYIVDNSRTPPTKNLLLGITLGFQ